MKIKYSYTIGALFNYDLNRILLIQKNKPAWQRGLLNLPGGKLERKLLLFKESPEKCAAREFQEETGLIIPASQWLHIGDIVNTSKKEKAYVVHVLTHRLPSNDLPSTLQNTNEPTSWFPVNHYPSNIISNVPWLVMFARNYHQQGHNDRLNFGTFEYTFNHDRPTETSTTSSD